MAWRCKGYCFSGSQLILKPITCDHKKIKIKNTVHLIYCCIQIGLLLLVDFYTFCSIACSEFYSVCLINEEKMATIKLHLIK